MTGLLLGLDLGGTRIKVCLLEEQEGSYRTVLTEDHDTAATRGPGGVAASLVETARDAVTRFGTVDRIGLGVPGLFDGATGAISLFPNLPGPWPGFPLRSTLEEGIGKEVTMVNDARAFTLAEGTVGAGAGFRTVACLTVGTGIGGGIMIEGRVHEGAFGVAGEIGHQTIDPDGPLCGCGNRGCVEALARADVLTSAAGKSTAEEVYAAAAAGEERSLAAIEKVATAIGIGLANVVTLIGPDRIVIGGGIARSGDLLLEPVRRTIRERVTLVPTDRLDVVPAELGSWAGAHGAAIAAAQA